MYEVVLKTVPEQKVACLRATIPTYHDVGDLFNEFCGWFAQTKARPTGAPLAIYYDEDYRESNVDVEVAFPVTGAPAQTERIGLRELPGIAQAACTVHRGPFEQVAQAYGALMAWVEANGYRVAGPCREVYLTPPGPGVDAADYVTEVQCPVARD